MALAFATLILYTPSSSSRPHFLLSGLLQQRVASGAEWILVSLEATAGALGICFIGAMHAKGNGGAGDDGGGAGDDDT